MSEITEMQTKQATNPKAVKPKASTGDKLLTCANKCENLNKQQAIKRVKELDGLTYFNKFELGGVLSHMRDESWYKEDGYETFKDYIESELNVSYRTAYNYMRLYESVLNSGCTWEQVEPVGWAKFVLVSPYITPENRDTLIGKAAELSYRQLDQWIQENLHGSTEKKVEDTGKTYTFKAHEDQAEVIDKALEKSMIANSTDSRTVAFEFLCMQYLEKSAGVTTVSVVDHIKQIGWQATLEIVDQLWPSLDMTVTAPSDDDVSEEQAA